MKMKKLLSAALAAAMVLSLAACGKKDQPAPSGSQPGSQSASQSGTTSQEVDFSGLITFHDGFQYFAAAYDLPLLASIEEEAGSEASAKEIVEITDLVKEKGIPVIFTEVNGSDATAQAIRRETGCAVEQLTMIMDGPDDQLENYYNALLANAKAVIDGFAGEELVK